MATVIPNLWQGADHLRLSTIYRFVAPQHAELFFLAYETYRFFHSYLLSRCTATYSQPLLQKQYFFINNDGRPNPAVLPKTRIQTKLQ